jgi:hypothetical protein
MPRSSALLASGVELKLRCQDRPRTSRSTNSARTTTPSTSPSAPTRARPGHRGRRRPRHLDRNRVPQSRQLGQEGRHRQPCGGHRRRRHRHRRGARVQTRDHRLGRDLGQDGRGGDDPVPPHPDRDAGHRARDRRGLEEDINIEYLAAPKEILRDEEGAVRGLIVQRMELGEPDSTPDGGARCPSRTTPTSCRSDHDHGGQPEARPGRPRTPRSSATVGSTATTGASPASTASGPAATTSTWVSPPPPSVRDARRPIAIHAKLQGVEPKAPIEAEMITNDKLMIDWYEAKDRDVSAR